MKRFGILWFGIGLMPLAMILSFTPLHWYLERAINGSVPDEYYPEYAYIVFGLPAAWIVIIVGALRAMFYKERS